MGAERRERGQALIEFIIFLPLMLTMYTMVTILGDAINGSINQQKATRGYFFHRIQNSPYITRPLRSGGSPVFTNWENFGMYYVGWADYLGGGQFPVYPCYKLNLPFASAEGEKCEDKYSRETTQFIRVGTIFGACGATMSRSTGGGASEYAEQPQSGNSDAVILAVISDSACLIK